MCNLLLYSFGLITLLLATSGCKIDPIQSKQSSSGIIESSSGREAEDTSNPTLPNPILQVGLELLAAPKVPSSGPVDRQVFVMVPKSTDGTPSSSINISADLVYRYLATNTVAHDSLRKADLAPEKQSCPDSAYTLDSGKNPRSSSNHDFPDVSPRALVTFDGVKNQYALYSGHLKTYRMTGNSFQDLADRSCNTPIHESTFNPAFHKFKSHEWFTSLYSKDGRNVFGFLQNDWQANNELDQLLRSECTSTLLTSSLSPARTAFCSCATRRTTDCWWLALTSTQSTDGGASFRPSTSPSSYTIARANLATNGVGTQEFSTISNPIARIEALGSLLQEGAFGFYQTTNIMKGVRIDENIYDNSYYMIMRLRDKSENRSPRFCLMQGSSTSALNSPNSWKGYYNGAFTGNLQNGECTFPIYQGPRIGITNSKGWRMIEIRHLSYNLFLKKYMIFGLAVKGGSQYLAVVLSNGPDMTKWSSDIYPITPGEFRIGNSLFDMNYPALIDHQYRSLSDQLPAKDAVIQSDDSLVIRAIKEGVVRREDFNEKRNFDLTGEKPWIYVTLRAIPFLLQLSGESDTAYKSRIGTERSKNKQLDLIRLPVQISLTPTLPTL